MVIADRRPQHPAFGIDELCQEGVAVIRLGEKVAAKGGLGVGLEDRHVDLAAVHHDKGFVVGDKLGEQ